MRVALYARVSTEEQAMHGLSIDAQLSALREAYPNGEEFVDLGISARKPISARPELQRLLRMVEKDQFDLIVFTKLDRWTRHIREYYKAQDVLETHNVAWRALHEDYETETAAGRLKVNIMLAVAQDEADRTGERIKAVFEEKRKKGLATAGKVAFGLQLKDGKIVPGPDAPIVREMFAYFIATRSSEGTARQFGRTRTGTRFLLSNRKYYELGVIDTHTWETAQSIFAGRNKHPSTDRVYLFTGILRCPKCGGALCINVKGDTLYYRCNQQYVGRCEGYHVGEKKVEKYLLEHLMPAVENVNVEIRQRQKKKADPSALKKKRDKLTDLYLNDLIDRSKYEQEFTKISDEIIQAEREPKQIDSSKIMPVLDAYNELSRKAKKAFWSNLVKSVTPTDDGFDITLCCT